MLELNKIHHGDCLELMKDIPDKSIDMILCDLPYGTTACKWDSVIPFEPLWEQYERVIKDNGAIVLTASQPFTSALIMSNPNKFKYTWVWNKKAGANFMLAKRQPIKIHEDIVVFNTTTYQPKMETRGKVRIKGNEKEYNGTIYGKHTKTKSRNNTYYPKSILEFSNASRNDKVHPTQKPVPLFEYLIKTYTNEGDTVLDNCIGSGTTAIAALNTGRFFIGIEKEKEYVDIADKRIEEHKQKVI